jgi:hypothetical protein
MNESLSSAFELWVGFSPVKFVRWMERFPFAALADFVTISWRFCVKQRPEFW